LTAYARNGIIYLGGEDVKTYTNLRMKPETHKELKILAAQEGITIIDLIKLLVDFYKQNNTGGTNG